MIIPYDYEICRTCQFNDINFGCYFGEYKALYPDFDFECRLVEAYKERLKNEEIKQS